MTSYGFRANRSTSVALIEQTDQISAAMEKENILWRYSVLEEWWNSSIVCVTICKTDMIYI